jgi:hypothetical protein
MEVGIMERFLTRANVKSMICLSIVLLITCLGVGANADISYIGDIGSATIDDDTIDDLVVTTTADVAAGDDIIIAYGTDPSQDIRWTITD